MNVNCNSIAHKNQSFFSETSVKNIKRTFVKPKINLELLSFIVWEKLPKLCDINTLLKFRLINKAIYLNSINRVTAFFCEKKLFDNYDAYSIEAYDKFVKPNLAKVSLKLTNSIEEYIQQLSHKDNFKENFSKFLFYKMHHLSEILPKTFAYTTKTLLNSTFIHNENPKFIDFFDLSPCGNYCITADKIKTVTLFEVTTKFDFKKLDVFKFTNVMLTSIKSINFTPENNLCIIFTALNDMDRLVLYKIDFNKSTNKHRLNKISELISIRSTFEKAIMKCNDTKLILLTEPINNPIGVNNSSLELWELFENQFIKKCQLDKSIIKIPDGDYGFHDVDLIQDLAVNKNASIVAIAVGKKFIPEHAVCLLTIDDELQSFTHEKIDEHDQLRFKEKSEVASYYVQGNLQLTASGELCVFTNSNEFGITGLKRNNNVWHKIFTITKGSYYIIQLMPYERNILVYREYFDTWNANLHKDVKIISFTKNNTHNSAEYSSCKVIKDKRYRSYFWQQNTNSGYFYVHPTGLATFKFNKWKNIIDIITIRQPTKLDKLTRIVKIV